MKPVIKNLPKKFEWLCAKCDGIVLPVRVNNKRCGMKMICQSCGASGQRMRDIAVEKYGR